MRNMKKLKRRKDTRNKAFNDLQKRIVELEAKIARIIVDRKEI